jgi:DNA-binding IclR family transcriptional regulator
MTDPPVELDEHRGMAAQKSTELRRRLREVQADQIALRRRQEEFERYALAAPSTTWPEAAAKARYLIQLFAITPEARDPRRQELIAKVLDELARLSDQSGSTSPSSETRE